MKLLAITSILVTVSVSQGDYGTDACQTFNSEILGMKDIIVHNPTPCVNGTTHCSDKTTTYYDYEICVDGVFKPGMCNCPNASCYPGGLFNECKDLSLLNPST